MKRTTAPALLTCALLGASGLGASLATGPAQAAGPGKARVSVASLGAEVEGRAVDITQVVRASRQVRLGALTTCVKTVGGRMVHGLGAEDVKARTVKKAGTTTRTRLRLAPGSYVAQACYRLGGETHRPGPKRAFKVAHSVATNPPVDEPGRVLFSDDFSGTGVYDHAKWGEWSTCTYNPTAAYGRIACGDRSRLDGAGHLVIPATPTQGTSISTKDTFKFTYGTLSARMKVPTQAGYWPAFWTLNGTTKGEQINGVAGEVDVLEAYTQYNDGYRSAIHHYSGNSGYGPAYNNPLCGGVDVRGQWHTYSARIEPGKVTFLFDGQVCWSTTKADLEGKPYGLGPDQPAGNWMLLTNAVGNSSQGMSPPTQDSVVLVDEVKVTGL